MSISQAKDTLVLACILVVVAIINSYTMPAEFYTGDAYAIKLEAVHWLRSGKFGFNGFDTEIISDYLAVKDQFYKFNESSGTYHNRWGVFNLLISSIPEIINIGSDEYIYKGIMRLDKHTLFSHNIFNCFLSILLALVLYKIVSLYTVDKLLKVLFVLSLLYCSFIWNYMRTQSYELVHLVLFSAFYYFFILFLRSLSTTKSSKLNSNFLLYNTFLAVICLSKSFYFFIYPVLFLTICVRILSDDDKTSLRSLSKRFNILYIIIPGVITLVVYLSLSQMYYGQLFLGHLLASPHSDQIAFSYKYIPERLYDYFISQDRGLIIHSPLLLLAVFGFKGFMIKYREEAIFLAIAFLFLLIFFSCSYTVGEWCYGPRLFLFILPILCIPSIIFIDQFRKNQSTVIIGMASILIGVALIFSCVSQTVVNSRAFHLRYTLERGLANTVGLTDEIREYFKKSHFSVITRDLNYIIAGEQRGFLAVNLMSYVPSDMKDAEFRSLSEFLADKYPINYYFSNL